MKVILFVIVAALCVSLCACTYSSGSANTTGEKVDYEYIQKTTKQMEETQKSLDEYNQRAKEANDAFQKVTTGLEPYTLDPSLPKPSDLTPPKTTEETTRQKENASQQEYTSAGTPINRSFDWSGISLIETSDSTCFSEIGYSFKRKVLVVTFRDSGASYAYYDVPSSVWSELRDAYSKGGYYNSDIKGHYDCEKLE